MSFLKNLGQSLGLTGTNDARRAARTATMQQLAAQKEGIDYLKAQNVLPTEMRDFALRDMGALYGMTGDGYDGDAALERMTQNPLYQAQLQNLNMGAGMGEEALLRNASAVGGLRGGRTIGDLGQYQLALQQQKNALLNQGYQGLQGFTSLKNYTDDIYGGMVGMGKTQAQGTIGQAQSQLAQNQASLSNIMGLGGMAIGAKTAGFF